MRTGGRNSNTSDERSPTSFRFAAIIVSRVCYCLVRHRKPFPELYLTFIPSAKTCTTNLLPRLPAFANTENHLLFDVSTVPDAILPLHRLHHLDNG